MQEQEKETREAKRLAETVRAVHSDIHRCLDTLSSEREALAQVLVPGTVDEVVDRVDEAAMALARLWSKLNWKGSVKPSLEDAGQTLLAVYMDDPS